LKRQQNVEVTYPCIEVRIREADLEPFSDLFWELGTVGIQEVATGKDTRLLQAFFPSETETQHLKLEFKRLSKLQNKQPLSFSLTLHECDPEEWIQSCKEGFSAFAVSPRIFIYPSWGSPSSKHPINVMMEPGHGFGTGSHESTRLCLSAMESLVPRATSFLDVGTGSGILSITAKMLSPELEVTAFDNDPLATDAARENIIRNGNPEILLFTGAIGALHDSFDLVVANLTCNLLRSLSSNILRVTERDLILSGFTTDQADLVLDGFGSAFSTSVEQRWDLNGWTCLHLV
jgi:ribosomal protein L11 methyltransferase